MAWTIDSTHTHLGFSVKHMMVTTVRGQFRKYGGTVRLDPKDFTRSTIEGWADVASIDTGVTDRDNHLRTGDFFDAASHPKITFKSTRIEHKADNEYLVHGEIMIRGVSKPITFDVDFSGTAKNPWGKTIAGVSAEGSLNRKDFDVSFNAPLETGGVLVGEKVKIEIECELVYAEDTAAVAGASA